MRNYLVIMLLCVLAGWLGHITATSCPTEDSINCYWDASTRGNGLGHSFTNIGGVNVWW